MGVGAGHDDMVMVTVGQDMGPIGAAALARHH